MQQGQRCLLIHQEVEGQNGMLCYNFNIDLCALANSVWLYASFMTRSDSLCCIVYLCCLYFTAQSHGNSLLLEELAKTNNFCSKETIQRVDSLEVKIASSSPGTDTGMDSPAVKTSRKKDAPLAVRVSVYHYMCK